MAGEFPIYEDMFRKSRWYTRGWTVQELTALLIIEFYTAGWYEISTKCCMQTKLSEITDVEVKIPRRDDSST